MNYTAAHIKSMFRVSHQTVQNWSKTFETFLSPSARPEKNRMRLFTPDDVSVFSLASDMIGQGGTYKDVLAALANGSRGGIPELSDNAITAPASGQMLALREGLTTAQDEIKRLQTALDEQRGRDKLLEEKLSAAEAEIKALNREIGRLEAKDKN